VIVVADRRVELDTIVEERLVRQLESIPVVLGGAAVVDVVAEHHDEIVREHFPVGLHLRRDFVLRRIAAAGVPDGREPYRPRFSREREKVGRRTRRRRRRGTDRRRLRLGGRVLTAAAGKGEEQ
jgi:hypothetical protein